MVNHTALQVAEWFLAHNRIMEAEAGAERISNLKLQKLLYYAQGSFLAITGKPLFDDEIEAWQNGPAIESVYQKYKAYRTDGIPFDEDFDSSAYSDEERELLTSVYNEFGQFSAWKLRNMTREEEPWLNTPQTQIISKAAIKKYFEKEYLVKETEWISSNSY